MKQHALWDHAGKLWVLLVAIGQSAAVAAELSTPLQPALSVLFVLTVPGLIILDLGRPADLLSRFMLGVVASVSFNVVLASALLLPNVGWFVGVGVVTYWAIQRHLQARLLLEEAG